MTDVTPRWKSSPQPRRARRWLNPVSDRKRRDNAEMAQRRRQLQERCGGRCEARLEGCTGRYEHAHHILRRSQGGSNDLSNLLALDHACHEWIHRNPAEAAELGLLTLRREPPSTAVRSVERVVRIEGER